MQETRYDGSEKLTLNPSMEQVKEAIENPKNKSVTIHKAGSIIILRDGTQYQIQENGEWRKIDKP